VSLFATPSPMFKAALISPCGRYRYWLKRSWDPGAWSLPIIMLNPSTADSEVDDPTIRRCMSFAKREKYGGIFVVNLFAYRATDPTELLRAADPIGPSNDHWLREAIGHASGDVLCAWGAASGEQGARVLRMCGATAKCLGKTKEGHPRHPLYVKSDQPFVPAN
jgi:hypothetical protein